MRINRFQDNKVHLRPPAAAAGFTMVEMMFSVSLFMLVVLACCPRTCSGCVTTSWCKANAGQAIQSRRTLQQLPTDIRSSKMWNVGSMNGNNFVANVDGAPQKGTALQLCQTTNDSQYILYFFDLSEANNSNGKLWRNGNSTNWNPVVIASNLIDTLYFTAENYNGQIQTNEGTSKAYKNVIRTTLQFKQFQYPLTQVGSNCLYDYYRIDFRATPHLPE